MQYFTLLYSKQSCYHLIGLSFIQLPVPQFQFHFEIIKIMHCWVYVLIVFCLQWQMSNYKFCQHFEKLNFEMKEAIYYMSWVSWRKQCIVWVELIEGSRNIVTGSIIIIFYFIFLTVILVSSLANIIWLG